MLIKKTLWLIPATRWAGLRDVFGSRFSRCCSYLSNSTTSCSDSASAPLFRLLGPPEFFKLNICPSDNTNTRNPLLLFPPPSSEEIDSFRKLGVVDPHPCIELLIRIYHCYIVDPNFLQFLLDKSYNHDSLTTLKIIGYMKHPRHSTRHSREQFYTAALWLHTYHPKSLASNIEVFSKFGCLKHWLELLYRLVNGPSVRETGIGERERAQRERVMKLKEKRSVENYDWSDLSVTVAKEKKLCSREERRLLMARRAIEMYNSDPNYRFLYDKISDLFAGLLKSDLELLDSGEFGKISLASKWCPSINSSYDRSTLFCESVARRLFPYGSNPEYTGIEEAHYVYRVRHRLQKRVLVPLRKALKLPEIYMTSNQWRLLPYESVNHTALRTYKRLFKKHDKDRFQQHIQEYSQKLKTACGRDIRYPHEIFRLLSYGHDREAAGALWKSMVQAFSEEGKFKNCIVVLGYFRNYDFPKLVQHFALSFQLLASDMSETESPWNGKILRQIAYPARFEQGEVVHPRIMEWAKIEGDDIQSKMECLKSLCSLNDYVVVNVWLVLDKILETAVCCDLSREKMVRRIFIFGGIVSEGNIYDAQDDVSKIIEAKRKKFEDCGYVMPELVLWMMDSMACCGISFVRFYYNGVITYIRDLSPRCIQIFLDKDGKLDRNTMLDSHFLGEGYMELKVFD